MPPAESGPQSPVYHLIGAALGTLAAVALQTTSPLAVRSAEAAGASPWPVLACTAVATGGAVLAWVVYFRAYVDYRTAGPGPGRRGGAGE